MTIAATIPTGPALRLHLIELLLPTAGRDVVELAAKAEGYVLGPLYHVPAGASADLADTIIRLSQSAAALGPMIGHGDDLAADLDEDRQWDAIIMPGDEDENPQAEPAPEPPAPPPVTPAKPPRAVTWTEERKAELRRLCLQGLEAKEIEAAMGLKDNGAFANAHRFGWTAEWREARERRRAGKPAAERDIPVGQSWAMTEHRTMAEVMDTEAEAQSAPEPPTPEPEVVVTRKVPGVELPPPSVEIREPAAKPKRDYAVTVWAKERKNRLRDMVLEGRSAEEMAAELGLAPLQVEQQIPRQCLTAAWAEAKAAKAGAALAKPRAAPERPRLPEDAIRRPPEAQAAAPATIDTVADYLRGCGQTVGQNETGAWTIDGCALPPKRLLAAANQYRTANGLPPFSVRGL